LTGAQGGATTVGMGRGDTLDAVPSHHRLDIDGLRGLAFLIVFLFHLQQSWLPGGFIGVDIFFTISGYVVAGTIKSSVSSEPSFQFLLEFYSKRMVRLIPTLAVVVTCASTVFWMAMPPWLPDTNGILSTGVDALLGWSNYGFLSASSDYFSDAWGSLATNLFTHTWSLGVESQFYMCFPVLCVCAQAFQCNHTARHRRLLIVVGVLVCASLVSSVVCAIASPRGYFSMLGFYALSPRFWEIGAGVVLQLAQEDIAARLSTRTKELAWTSVACFFACLWVGSRMGGFCFPCALLAVGSTVCFIAAGFSQPSCSVPNSLLARVCFVYIGQRSYSLYLWHWPVCVMFRWLGFMDLLRAKLVAVTLTTLLAVITYELLEVPMRSLRKLAPWKSSSLMAALLWGSVSYVHYLQSLSVSLNDNANLRAPSYFADTDRCFAQQHWTVDMASLAETCLSPDRGWEAAKAVFVLGDSHAHHLVPGITRATSLFRQRGFSIRYSTVGSGCAYLPQTLSGGSSGRGQGRQSCTLYNVASTLMLAQNLREGDIVIVAHVGISVFASESIREDYMNHMLRLNEFVLRSNATRLLVSDVVHLPARGIMCLPSDYLDPALAHHCEVPLESARRQSNASLTAMESLRAEGGILVHDLMPVMCTKLSCGAMLPGTTRLAFYDDNHLTDDASAYAVESLEKFLQHKSLL